MKKTFLYFQPEYVSKFKCDGQFCGAHCCRNWIILIDKKTYKKYSHIKPKAEAEKILRHIKKDDTNNYRIELDETLSCPMLTEDNFCSIQKKYGEDFLSNVCIAYPRTTYDFGNFFERSLSLTCPVAANMALLSEESMAFEQVEVSEKVHNFSGRLGAKPPPVPKNLLKHIISIQFAAISILQERPLSLDARLIVLGFFFDKLEELISSDQLQEIDNLTALYSSENFLQEKTSRLVESIQFDSLEHIKIMMNAFEFLYGDDSAFAHKDKLLLDAVIKTLDINPDENNEISASKLAATYEQLRPFRKNFIEKFSNIFENYLVNEFFYNLYPFKFPSSIIHNYGFFLITYKILELVAISFAAFAEQSDDPEIQAVNEKFLCGLIGKFVHNVDHTKSYVEKISEYLNGKEDIVFLMQSLLQGT